ncbi:MAG: hypothetical protein DRG59_08870 [Deltaproteobacteria bacterium]|nr:MAG: hypothetical protein DRG59_08870 [Deltaproteobacteria bacterium]HEC31611.1 PEP-CTERM sorting domain-containing protein [Deltaproteobacteria bacterium]
MERFLKVSFVLILLVVVCGIARISEASIYNGDFSFSLDGWNSGAGIHVDAGVAVLETQGAENGPVMITLSQEVEFSSLCSTLQFDFFFERTDDDVSPGSTFIVPDAFQAAYIDDADETFDMFFVAANYHGNYYPSDPASLVALPQLGDFFRFSANVSTLAGRKGTLRFDLRDEDDGFFSRVYIDNVQVSPVPVPGTLLLLGSGLSCLVCLKKKSRNARRLFSSNNL